MNVFSIRTPLLAALLTMAATVDSRAAAADSKFGHEDWQKVVSRFVDARGRVNYEALAKDRADLDRYLASVEKTSPKTKPALFPTRNDQLAYYLNAYNAQVFKGVLARGPEKESVWKGGLISGYKFFVGMDIFIGGEKTSLKSLEDNTVREGFKDPRVHAALNCASLGCPRLPQNAFEGDLLDQQLDGGMTEFVGEARNVTIDDGGRTVTLSKIFDWFEKDFLGFEKANGSVEPNILDYVNRYRGGLPKVPRAYKVKYFEYDKGINKQ